MRAVENGRRHKNDGGHGSDGRRGGAATGRNETDDENITEEERLVQVLRRPDWLRLRLADLMEQRETCRRRCTRTTGRYGGTASFGGGYARGDMNLAALADMDRKLSLCRTRLAEASNRAEAVLRLVEALPRRTAARDAVFLRFRYLRGLSGSPLRDALECAGYPSRSSTLYSWQRSAHRSGVLALASLSNSAGESDMEGGAGKIF